MTATDPDGQARGGGAGGDHVSAQVVAAGSPGSVDRAVGPVRRGVRFVAVGYFVALTVATLWPRLQVEAPGVRIDLVSHFVAFGVAAGLVIAAGWFGPRALGRRNITRAMAAVAVYAALDELAQSAPGLGRTTGLDDLAANVAGVLTAGSAAVLLGRGRPLSAVGVVAMMLAAAAGVSLALG